MAFPSFLKQSTENLPFSGWAFGLVVFGLATAISFLWWAGTARSDVKFLPAMAPAEWIVYPVPPDVNTHPSVELPAVFERSFSLDAAPLKSRLRIAGFHRYTVSVNGGALGPCLEAGKDWKHPDTYDVTGLLHSGQNQIQVTVFNATGPAALWFALDTGGVPVNSGTDWRVSLAGSSWLAAVPASARKPAAAYGAVYGLPNPRTALSQCWPILVILTLLVTMGWWLSHRSSGLGAIRLRLEAWFTQGARLNRWRVSLLLLGVVGAWLVLFGNNLTKILILTGFDSPGHLDYIRFIQEHHALPMANAGWEMFQPPLYYLISAGWLGLLHLSVSDANGLMALRVLGLAIGITHLAIVWAALRLIFPGKDNRAGWGLLMAAALPPMIYLSHSVTNEAFAAMMVSACVWLTLRALQREHLTWTMGVALGLCLGAALLSKASALLVLPVVFGTLFWHWMKTRKLTFAQWIGRIGLISTLCALLCGWHYVGLWNHFGSPFVANWDTRLGFSWWQDDGYRTSAFYFGGGDVLFHPWSGASHRLSDCLYATLWGDGLLSGSSSIFTRPPWNYDLMAVVYWLALIPTLMVLAGGVMAIVSFVRRPTPQWFFLLGFGALALWAVVYISLILPYYSLVKSFFALSALIPLCALAAWGMNSLMTTSSRLVGFLGVVFLVWAATSYASFWVSRSSVPWAFERTMELVKVDRLGEAIEFLEQRQRVDAQNADLQFLLAGLLTKAGQGEKASKQIQAMIRQHPEDSRGPYWLALSQQHEPGLAIAQLHKSIALTPVFDSASDGFSPLLDAAHFPKETVAFCRQALAVAPYNADLRQTLGVALMWQDQKDEAHIQLQFACLADPKRLDLLVDRAWELATDSNAAVRNGSMAVRLAEFACAFSKYGNVRHLIVLASAYAEEDRYAEAVKCAEQAEALAVSRSDAKGVAASRELLKNLRLGFPYRQK